MVLNHIHRLVDLVSGYPPVCVSGCMFKWGQDVCLPKSTSLEGCEDVLVWRSVCVGTVNLVKASI